MRKIILIIISALLIATFFAMFSYFDRSKPKSGIESTVEKVIDGDTIQLANGDKIRLIGIDAPEKNQIYYKEVTGELKKLEGKTVRLEKDKTNKDRYGRYLRYVFLGKHFVNLELVRNGLAYAYIVSPDKKYEEKFFAAEKYARENGLGVWKRSEFSNCLSVSKFHYNARGDDNENLNDEYFIMKNSCDFSIDIFDWTLRNQFNTFKVPDFVFEKNSEIKIISGAGKDSHTEKYLKSSRPVWNNKRDTLSLRDSLGNLALIESYSGY